MKPTQFVSAVLAVACALLLQGGCDEQAAAPQQLSPNWFLQFEKLAEPGGTANTAPAPEADTVSRPEAGMSPTINFEKVAYNFGYISPDTSSVCEFAFKNTGTGILKIGEIEKACGCTVASLDKTEYAPGETGTVSVKYLSDAQLGATTKQLLVHTNDPSNPAVLLSINATISAKVDCEPKTLSLVLKQDNAGCPALRLVSIDNQPFAITHFISTDNTITADFDPSVQQTSFLLQPKVNMESLEQSLTGMIEIGLSHPECKKVLISVSTTPRFRVAPRTIVVRSAVANQAITKTVRILNNYNEPFELESAVAPSGAIKVLNTTLVSGGYDVEVEINPPADKTRSFVDTLSLKIKNGGQVDIPCNIFYSAAPTAAETQFEEKSKECKICGPRLINPETGEVEVHHTSSKDKGS